MFVNELVSTIPTQNTCNICAVKPKYCKTLANIKLDLGFPVGIEIGSFGIYDHKFSEKYAFLTLSMIF